MALLQHPRFLAASTFAILTLTLFSLASPWFQLTVQEVDPNYPYTPPNTYIVYLAPTYFSDQPSLLYSVKHRFTESEYEFEFGSDVCKKVEGALITLSFASVAALVAFILSASVMCCPSCCTTSCCAPTALFYATGGVSIMVSVALVGAIGSFSSIDPFSLEPGMGLLEAAAALLASIFVSVLAFKLGCKGRAYQFQPLSDDSGAFFDNSLQVRPPRVSREASGNVLLLSCTLW